MVKISRGGWQLHHPPPPLPGQICRPKWLDHRRVTKKRNGHWLYVNNTVKSSRELIEQLKERYDKPKVIKLESYRSTLRKTVDELKGLDDQILDSIDVELLKSSVEDQQSGQVFGKVLTVQFTVIQT